MATSRRWRSREARLKDGIEAVSIVTPNHMHFPVAAEFLKRGIHVICDKPLTSKLADAKKLAKLVEQSERFRAHAQLHRLSDGAPRARAWCASGELGEIRVVQVEYRAGLARGADRADGPEAGRVAHRSQARRAPAAATGDIGTHAYNLAAVRDGP